MSKFSSTNGKIMENIRLLKRKKKFNPNLGGGGRGGGGG